MTPLLEIPDSEMSIDFVNCDYFRLNEYTGKTLNFRCVKIISDLTLNTVTAYELTKWSRAGFTRQPTFLNFQGSPC